MTKSNIFHELKDYALISVGVILYAIGVTVFMLPYSLTTGGVAGIASIIYYVTGVEVQVTY
ncbi:MAG: YitT family protein, partial [Bacteroidaceae bacterium]|nr:YitT family protein [Bacteroidaceae bacterium]